MSKDGIRQGGATQDAGGKGLDLDTSRNAGEHAIKTGCHGLLFVVVVVVVVVRMTCFDGREGLAQNKEQR